MSVGVSLARVRVALGDGATIEQARAVLALLQRAGLVGSERGTLELAGVAEIAALRGVSSSAISQRADLPKPIQTLKQGRVWDLQDVRKWLEGLQDA